MTPAKAPLCISYYSICFPIAFRVDDQIIDEYFTEIKKTGKYTEAKRIFVSKLNGKIKNQGGDSKLSASSSNLNCADNIGECENYACQCLCLANRFHDDYLIDNKVMQVSLGRANVKYSYKDRKRTKHVDFEVNLILHITNENPELSTNKHTSNEENYNTQLIFETHKKGKTSVRDIIFLKHLFFKRSLKCKINYKDKKFEQITSITDWANIIIYDLIDSFADKKFNEKNRLHNFCFESSFAEVNVGTTDKILKIYKSHKNKICGLLTANEKYKFLGEKYVDETLKLQWKCYNFSHYYFLNNSVLNIRTNFDKADFKSSLTDYFDKYKRQSDGANKYIAHISAKNCIAGLNNAVLYDYLDCNKKRFILTEGISEAKGILESPQDIKYIQERQNKLNSIIETYPHGAIGRASLNQCLMSAFNIRNLNESLQECYSRMSSLVESLYNRRLTNRIFGLTILTVIVPIAIFATEQRLNRDDIFGQICKIVVISATFTALSIIIYKNRNRLWRWLGNKKVILTIIIVSLAIICLYLFFCVLQPQILINIINVIC